MKRGLAGILFVLYSALRPFSDEMSLQGARAFASSQWVVAHVLAIGCLWIAAGMWQQANAAGA
jgi:hypothetical protein